MNPDTPSPDLHAAQALATQVLHGPRHYRAIPADPVVEPIAMNTTFHYPSAATAEEWFLAPKDHFVYSRYGNPTVRDFEERMTLLEQGADSVAFASGTAAFLGALLTVAQAGQHVLLQRNCYGGTYYLTAKLGPSMGIAASLIDPTDLATCEAALTPATTAICLETPSNPTAGIVDIARAADWAHAHGLLVVVDSTFASPILQQPLTLGADIVWHSGTKYIGGHGDVMGGIATTATPELAEAMWGKWMHTLGTNLSPFNAFLLVRGLKTLALRVERQSANALALANWLSAERRVARVSYPGLVSHPGHEIASTQMRAYGGMLAFEPVGGQPAAFAVHDRLRLVVRATSLGDVHSLISHPASTSHRQFTAAERLEWGVTPGTLRVSVGIEDIGDLIADFDQALG